MKHYTSTITPRRQSLRINIPIEVQAPGRFNIEAPTFPSFLDIMDVDNMSNARVCNIYSNPERSNEPETRPRIWYIVPSSSPPRMYSSDSTSDANSVNNEDIDDCAPLLQFRSRLDIIVPKSAPQRSRYASQPPRIPRMNCYSTPGVLCITWEAFRDTVCGCCQSRKVQKKKRKIRSVRDWDCNASESDAVEIDIDAVGWDGEDAERS
jgi:hypothetical protein